MIIYSISIPLCLFIYLSVFPPVHQFVYPAVCFVFLQFFCLSSPQLDDTHFLTHLSGMDSILPATQDFQLLVMVACGEVGMCEKQVSVGFQTKGLTAAFVTHRKNLLAMGEQWTGTGQNILEQMVTKFKRLFHW